jgi:hypothetical protein
VSNWRRVAAHYARVYHLPTRYFLRQIKQESGFNPNARSPAGALGIAQIMPGTARGWGVNPMNPRQALKAAAHNMARYVRRYGNYRNALIAYNAGPGRVGHSLPAETRKYIAAILGGGSGGGLTRGGGGGGGAKHFGNVNSTVGGDRLSKLIKVMEGFNNPSGSLTSIADAYGQATGRTPWGSTTPSFGMYGMPGNLGDPAQMGLSGLPPNPIQPFQFQSHWQPTSMLTTLKNIEAMRKRIGAPEPGHLTDNPRGSGSRGGGGGRGLHAGGGWGGTQGFFGGIGAIAHRYGAPATSRKRGTRLTANGGTSDHFSGNRNAYATDYGIRGFARGRKLAMSIARHLGVSYHPNSWNKSIIRVGGHRYRVQILWYAPDGSHRDHVHVGIKRI